MLEYWIKYCAGTLEKRMELFGYEDHDKLEALMKFPKEAVALARNMLLGAGRKILLPTIKQQQQQIYLQ